MIGRWLYSEKRQIFMTIMLIADFNYLECLDGKECGIEGQWPIQGPRCQRDCHGEKGKEEGVELHYLNILVGIFLNILMI